MARYRKLLVATDGSESGMHALRESFRLADNEKCWITVTCVIPPYEGELELLGTRNILESIRKPCEEALAKAKEIAEQERALIRTVCEEGAAYERIVDLAEAENCDLIIMGRRGLTRIERSLIGSVTARVIGHSQRDILVVPNETQVGFRNILFATDGSRFSRAASEKAIDFAQSYGGSLSVVSVVDVPDELYAEAPVLVDDLVKKAHGFVAEVCGMAKAAGIKTTSYVHEGESYKTIVRIAQQETADLIVMGSHGRTGLKRLLMGSVTEKVIGYAPCPVLVVKT